MADPESDVRKQYFGTVAFGVSWKLYSTSVKSFCGTVTAPVSFDGSCIICPCVYVIPEGTESWRVVGARSVNWADVVMHAGDVPHPAVVVGTSAYELEATDSQFNASH